MTLKHELMKRNRIIMFIFGLCLSFVNFSCDKENPWHDDLKSDFEAAAELHTEAMEACLEAIKSTHIADASALLGVVENTAAGYISESPAFTPCRELGQAALKNEIKRLYSFRKKVSEPGYKGEYSYNDFLIYTLQGHMDDLSEGQYNLLMSVNNIMETYGTADDIIPLLTQVKDTDCLSLPEEERYIVYSVTTIGIESVSYWSEHMDDWIDEFTGGDPDKLANMPKWFNWGSIVGSDVAGAIGGAIGGAITGSLAGGIGAGPGALAGGAGGAVGVSATDAVLQVIDHCF